jgi:hypothetical protein
MGNNTMKRLSKARDKLLSRMIHIFGHEHSQVLYFSYACEILPNGIRNYNLLRNWVRTVEALNKRVGFDVPWE